MLLRSVFITIVISVLISSVSAQARTDVIYTCSRVELEKEVLKLSNQLKDADAKIRAKAIRNLTCQHPLTPSAKLNRLLLLSLKDSSSSVREAAAQSLPYSLGKEAVPDLLYAAGDTNPNVRAHIATPLGAFANQPKVQKKLLLLLKDDVALVRVNAIKAIRNGPKELWLPEIINGMKDTSPEVRRISTWIAAHSRNRGVVKSLIAALSEQDEKVRRYAIGGLSVFEAEAALEPLKRIIDDPESKIRLQAVRAYAIIGKEQVLQILVNFLSEKDADFRSAIAKAWGEINLEATAPHLLNLLNDNEPVVRKTALQALGKMKHENITTALIKAIDDKDESVRKTAVEVISERGDKATISILVEKIQIKEFTPKEAVIDAALKFLDKRFIPILIALPETMQKFDRHSRVIALKKFKDRRVVSAIIESLKDPYNNVRLEAIKFLHANIDKKYLKHFLIAVNDKERCVRKFATEGLGIIAGPLAIQALEEAVQDDDIIVKRSAIEALKKINTDKTRRILNRSSLHQSLKRKNNSEDNVLLLGCDFLF